MLNCFFIQDLLNKNHHLYIHHYIYDGFIPYGKFVGAGYGWFILTGLAFKMKSIWNNQRHFGNFCLELQKRKVIFDSLCSVLQILCSGLQMKTYQRLAAAGTSTTVTDRSSWWWWPWWWCWWWWRWWWWWWQ